jgi:serine protease Do
MPFEPEMPYEPEMPFDLDSRAWLGVGFMTGEDGALVTSVISGSPAEAAGIRAQDTIVEVDGESVTPDFPLDEQILGYSPGDRVEITLMRNGRERVVSVRLGSRSDSGLQWFEDSFPFGEPLAPGLDG